MKLKIFSVFDKAVHAFLPPFFLPTDQTAVRAFSDCVKDEKHAFYRHPGDYTLFRLGEFDDVTGAFVDTISQVVAIGNQFATASFVKDDGSE